jgi:hypothetical protein
MDIQINKLIKLATLCLVLMFSSHAVRAQFMHKWQLEATAGMASPVKDKYFISEGYLRPSLVGNMDAGQRLEVQLMHHLNQRVAIGAGVGNTSFNDSFFKAKDKSTSFNLNSMTLGLSGKVYPMGKNHRFTPFFQTGASYGQVSLEYGKHSFKIDSLSQHAGNPDHPVLLQVVFNYPAANQKSNVYGIAGTIGMEYLLKDGLGLMLQSGYHLQNTKKMQLLQENLKYWDVRIGMFTRMFKTKRFY